MIPLDSLRSAVLAEQPWSELDRLVRAELAYGRLTNQIYDELVGMTEELRATPGFSEQAEDAFGDTLDRLSGFCHANSAYKNPPVLPTEEEIAKLPRWAQVAFAARCARRALPLYERYTWPSPRKDQIHLLRMGVYGAEIGMDQEKASGLVSAFELIHGTTLNVAETAHTPAYKSLQVVRAVSLALQLRMEVDSLNSDLLTRACSDSVLAASRAGDEIDIVSQIRYDFDHLTKLSLTSQWSDDTPAPPEVYGPLWPDGPPKGWPADPDAPQHNDLALEVVSRDGLDERIVEDEVVNLFNAMNRYHIARGGQPLTIEDLQPLISALVPAGV